MSDTESNEKFFGYLALVLFVAGLLVPFLIALFLNEGVALGFGIVAEVLALVFGILGWKQKTGKVAVIGVTVLLVLAVVNGIIYISISEGYKEEIRIRTEEMKAKEAVRQKAEQKNSPDKK